MTEMHSVLIVDDEKNIADTLALILQAEGYAVKAAYNGSIALAMARDDPPDLILSDVLMPGINGIELAMTARREFPRCHVLLSSGQAASAGMLEEARLRGHEFEVWAKPVELDDLLKRIADLFASAQEGGPPTRATT